jgi:UPF0176 protein
MEISNIAAYKFVSIPDPAAWRGILKEHGKHFDLKGTILLAPEGINMFLAGEPSGTSGFLDYLRAEPLFEGRFVDLEFKESLSVRQPFKRLVVRLKKEIITMRHPTIVPGPDRAPSVRPEILKKWLDQGHDDNGKAVVLLDTRNNYEVNIGTFDGALHLDIDNFSAFPQAFRDIADDTKDDLQNKTIVSFCTGGIRCEKAALFMRELNLDNVYQLDGGILRYFEDVGGEHWKGECFVFDRRVALDPDLQPTTRKYSVTAPPERNAGFLKWLATQENGNVDPANDEDKSPPDDADEPRG